MHTEICEILLSYGTSINKEDYFKLFEATGNTEICKLLVDYGADINPVDIAEKEVKNDILKRKETFGK